MRRCDCTQRPELRQTGRSYPDADLICPVCYKLWHTCKEGISETKPINKCEGGAMENSISAAELKTHINDRAAHIRYLLRLGIGKDEEGKDGAFKSMAEMAKDLGVTDGYIRQIKHRGIHKRSTPMLGSDYTRGVLRLWNAKGMPVEAISKNII